MSENNSSMVMTGLMVVALTALNYFFMTKLSFFNVYFTWPILFAFAVVIAARIWRGHGDL